MIRRLFTFLSALSLLLCAGAALLWVRCSDGIHSDCVQFERNGHRPTPLTCAPMAMAQMDQLRRAMKWSDMWQIESFTVGTASLRGEFFVAHDFELTERYQPGWRYVDLPFNEQPLFGRHGAGQPGVTHRLGTTLWDSRISFLHLRGFAFPFWMPVAITGVLPSAQIVFWTARKISRRRRKATSRCPNCGYDLCATPQRCPECGAVPANVEIKA
ncbi:MAG: hypothetical protein JWL69_3672 [Phycisphaerales bacterium]|nr:hypothetical protein [Phycisphaerales bacterium]